MSYAIAAAPEMEGAKQFGHLASEQLGAFWVVDLVQPTSPLMMYASQVYQACKEHAESGHNLLDLLPRKTFTSNLILFEECHVKVLELYGMQRSDWKVRFQGQNLRRFFGDWRGLALSDFQNREMMSRATALIKLSGDAQTLVGTQARYRDATGGYDIQSVWFPIQRKTRAEGTKKAPLFGACLEINKIP